MCQSEFPKIRGTLLGVPIARIIVFWGSIGVPIFGETTINSVQPYTPKHL